jgi:hypothetical protein
VRGQHKTGYLPIADYKTGRSAYKIEGNGNMSLRRPKLSINNEVQSLEEDIHKTKVHMLVV